MAKEFKEKSPEELEKLTPAQKEKYLAEKEAFENQADVSTKEFYDKKMKDVNSGKKVVINLTDKVRVKFLKDTKFIKAGDKVYTISQSAFDTYNLKEKVVEKVN